MRAPLSWLKDYVTITLPPKELGERLTEIGLGCEKIIKDQSDTIFELEITPNRPDLLSIIGVAREIAAQERKTIKLPINKIDVRKVKPKDTLPLTIKADTKISPRFTGIVIKNITVKESPVWLKERLEKIDQRSINNIVDITNYVMFELGNPLHAFDYDKIEKQKMEIVKAHGGEKFKSVDGISYHLPKDAVIVKSGDEVIDLCGIKGGYNSGTFEHTKTLFVWAPVEDPILIRRTSLALGLRSEASSIFERGVNRGGTIDALNRAVNLILELSGGEIASEMIDVKTNPFEPWKLDLRVERLNKTLGIDIPEKKIMEILESLNLSPVILEGIGSSQKDSIGLKALQNDKVITCTIPTYRNDLKIEEDLIEEVARLYGYNNFPKTLPEGQVPTEKIPYFKEYRIDEKVKNYLCANDFSEVYTYSLISEKDLGLVNISPEHTIRVDNPVSREFEYLRPTLIPNLLKAANQNRAQAGNVNLFEIGKVYKGNSLKDVKEQYVLSGITVKKSYHEIKGMLEGLFEDLGINPDFTGIEVTEEGIIFEVDYSRIVEKVQSQKTYKKFIPIPKYPPVIEDLAIIASEEVSTGEIIAHIQKQSDLIMQVSLLDQYENSRTFHIVYQHPEKNLTNDDVKKIREIILKSLEKEYSATIKK